MMDKKNKTVSTRADFKVAQRAALYNTVTKKYAIAKVAHEDSSFNQKYGPWDLFGGHIDADEINPEDAMRREIKEESGVEVTFLEPLRVIDFSGYGNDIDRNARRLLIGYSATCETEEITLSDEHTEYLWLSADEIINHKEAQNWLKDFITRAEKKRMQNDAQENILRVLADFDNYKKRSEQQHKDFAQYASERTIMEMIPVLDNFHAATGHIPEDQVDSPWIIGIMYIQQQMEKVFEDNDVTTIVIAEGDTFDPLTMEAIKSNVQSDTDGINDHDAKNISDEEMTSSSEKVIKVVQNGYKIKEKIMRPARVEVG